METTNHNIRIAILEDHQGIIDGYLYRLGKVSDIEVVAILNYGEELEPVLAQFPVDVVLLDVQVPTSPDNRTQYPILFEIPKILKQYPNLSVLVVTMHSQRLLIRALLDTGVSGFILKDDTASIRDLASIIRLIDDGGIHLSPSVFQILMDTQATDLNPPLNPRQLEAITICAAYPNESTAQLATRMEIESSTMRNLLSGAYIKLGVRTRAAAILKARQMGLIFPDDGPVDLQSLGNERG